MQGKGIFDFETGRNLGIYQHGHIRAIIWLNCPLANLSQMHNCQKDSAALQAALPDSSTPFPVPTATEISKGC
jgi:hypothetical protein